MFAFMLTLVRSLPRLTREYLLIYLCLCLYLHRYILRVNREKTWRPGWSFMVLKEPELMTLIYGMFYPSRIAWVFNSKCAGIFSYWCSSSLFVHTLATPGRLRMKVEIRRLRTTPHLIDTPQRNYTVLQLILFLLVFEYWNWERDFD